MKKSRGFSLVEALVAAGILGGVAIFTMKIIRHYQLASKTKRAMAELNSFHQSVLATLKDPYRCSTEFATKQFGEELPVPLDLKVPKDLKHPDDSRIKLTKIKIWHPGNLNGYPLMAPFMPKTPTQNGWLIGVSFTYDVYKLKAGETDPHIQGPTEITRYSLFVFNNFKALDSVSDPQECSGSDKLINGTQEYTMVKEDKQTQKPVYSIKKYSLCWDTHINNPIVSCFHY